MLFTAQGAELPVDAATWIRELRARNPREYGERQQNFAGRQRAKKAYTATIDAVTAALLLEADSVTSNVGKALLSQFGYLFVHFDNDCLEACVRDLVPKIQALFKSLSDDNLKAMVEMVVALSSKDNCNITWMNKTIGDLLVNLRAVTNATCARALLMLGQAVPPTRTLPSRTKQSRLTVVEEVGEESAEAV